MRIIEVKMDKNKEKNVKSEKGLNNLKRIITKMRKRRNANMIIFFVLLAGTIFGAIGFLNSSNSKVNWMIWSIPISFVLALIIGFTKKN